MMRVHTVVNGRMGPTVKRTMEEDDAEEGIKRGQMDGR